MSRASRVPLVERLPELYRTEDAKLAPPGQLAAYLSVLEQVFAAVHASIDGLYDDLFLETCDDWVVAYIADLLGTSLLKGPPSTIRRDVADTIPLRRRKGTLSAVERLADNLTEWACRAVELRENLGWTQHLNHLRPDPGGVPPLVAGVPRGGTAPIRAPATLSLRGTPFDPFAYTADVKQALDGSVHPNLPNLVVFLWRLATYHVGASVPLAKRRADLGAPPAGSSDARYVVGFDLDPLDRPVQLFNVCAAPLDPDVATIARLTDPDAVPGPILPARLAWNGDPMPSPYVAVSFFDDDGAPAPPPEPRRIALELLLPASERPAFPDAGWRWSVRGANLCAWERALRPPVRSGELVVDPAIGRVLVGVATRAQRDALVEEAADGTLRSRIYAGFTYGAVGPVGAHPVPRGDAPAELDGAPAELRVVSAFAGGVSLAEALADLHQANGPVVVEIRDSLVHELDPSALPGVVVENGLAAIALRRSLVIRAASRERPILRLAAPLAFRPADPADDSTAVLRVRLEGLFVAAGDDLAASAPLVARAAVASLELTGCTLDPGGWRVRAGGDARALRRTALRLSGDLGFEDLDDLRKFDEIPRIVLERTVAGALAVDEGHRLSVRSSIVEAGAGVGDVADTAFAVGAASGAPEGWGAPLDLESATFLGRVRVAEGRGSGGIFVHRLEVLRNQEGCIRLSFLSGEGDRAPPNHACVRAPDAHLAFTDEWSSDPAYGQLAAASDVRIRTRGPDDDAMGAFGFLLEAHRRANLEIRLREFTPVGVRPLVLAVT